MKRHFLFFAALTLSVGLSAETAQQTDHIGTGTTITTNSEGQISGTNLYYNLWYVGGSASMTYYQDGTFSSNLNNLSGFLAETGLHYDNSGVDPTQYNFIIDYAFTKTGSAEVGYIGSHGWMADPTLEYHVIDDWYNSRPGSWLGTYKGSYTADDDTYDVYTEQLYMQPTPFGTMNFNRLYSVRKTTRQSGQISLSSHFKAWESIAVSGKPVQVNFMTYAYDASNHATGTFDLTKLEISEHGSYIEKYGLYVKGEQVTSKNDSDILGNGTMSYNDDTKTLTLNNANITYEEEHILSPHQDLVINCVGTNTFIATGANNGIEEFGGDVTITGSGSLSINSDDGAAIYTQNDLTIQGGCVVTVQTDNQYAIELSGGTLTVDGATLIAKGNGTNPTIIECDELIMLNGVAIRSAHTYDTAQKKFFDAAGNEAKDDIIIGVEGTGLKQLTVDNARCTVRKFIRNNQLHILHNGKLYNAVGRKVK